MSIAVHEKIYSDDGYELGYEDSDEEYEDESQTEEVLQLSIDTSGLQLDTTANWADLVTKEPGEIVYRPFDDEIEAQTQQNTAKPVPPPEESDELKELMQTVKELDVAPTNKKGPDSEFSHLSAEALASQNRIFSKGNRKGDPEFNPIEEAEPSETQKKPQRKRTKNSTPKKPPAIDPRRDEPLPVKSDPPRPPPEPMKLGTITPDGSYVSNDIQEIKNKEDEETFTKVAPAKKKVVTTSKQLRQGTPLDNNRYDSNAVINYYIPASTKYNRMQVHGGGLKTSAQIAAIQAEKDRQNKNNSYHRRKNDNSRKQYPANHDEKQYKSGKPMYTERGARYDHHVGSVWDIEPQHRRPKQQRPRPQKPEPEPPSVIVYSDNSDVIPITYREPGAPIPEVQEQLFTYAGTVTGEPVPIEQPVVQQIPMGDEINKTIARMEIKQTYEPEHEIELKPEPEPQRKPKGPPKQRVQTKVSETLKSTVLTLPSEHEQSSQPAIVQAKLPVNTHASSLSVAATAFTTAKPAAFTEPPPMQMQQSVMGPPPMNATPYNLPTKTMFIPQVSGPVMSPYTVPYTPQLAVPMAQLPPPPIESFVTSFDDIQFTPGAPVAIPEIKPETVDKPWEHTYSTSAFNPMTPQSPKLPDLHCILGMEKDKIPDLEKHIISVINIIATTELRLPAYIVKHKLSKYCVDHCVKFVCECAPMLLPLLHKCENNLYTKFVLACDQYQTIKDVYSTFKSKFVENLNFCNMVSLLPTQAELESVNISVDIKMELPLTMVEQMQMGKYQSCVRDMINGVYFLARIKHISESIKYLASLHAEQADVD